MVVTKYTKITKSTKKSKKLSLDTVSNSSSLSKLPSYIDQFESDSSSLSPLYSPRKAHNSDSLTQLSAGFQTSRRIYTSPQLPKHRKIALSVRIPILVRKANNHLSNLLNDS